MKSAQQIEAWALQVAQRVVQGAPVEDFRVEVKAAWPEPQRAARQIAGHANAAAPDNILWVLGLDERNRSATGVPANEFSNWWAATIANFEGIAPECRELVVPFDAISLVALLLDSDRAPYLVRNPSFGSATGNAIAYEVPWRSGTSTRTAKRHELLSVLAPQVELPEVEVIEASFTAAVANQQATVELYSQLYLIPALNQTSVFPLHRAFVRAEIEGVPVFDGLRVWYIEASDRNNLRGQTQTEITATDTELIVRGPGMVRFQAGQTIVGPPSDYGGVATCTLHLESTNSRRPLVVAIPMRRDHEALCSFRYFPSDTNVIGGFRHAQETRAGRRKRLQQRAKQLGYHGELLGVPEHALAVLVERPAAWEYRFLQFLIADQLSSRRRQRLDFRFGAPLPEGSPLDLESTNNWFQARITAIQKMVESLKLLVDVAVPEALGPSGVPGDPYRLFHAATAFGELYEQAIHWGRDFHRVSVPKLYHRLFNIMPKSAEGLLEAIEELRDKLWMFIELCDSSPPAAGEKRIVTLDITLRNAIPLEAFEEIEKIGRGGS